jgi:hypothetical protein
MGNRLKLIVPEPLGSDMEKANGQPQDDNHDGKEKELLFLLG